MRYANWVATLATGASLSLLSADAMAQLKTSPKAEAGAQKSRSLAAEGEPGEVRETRRIPVIDANASATFRSSQLIGTSITDAEGRSIGKVVDFVSDSRGNIRYPIVSYSGSAGFSGKLFAIPTTGLSFTAGADNTTTAQLSFDPRLLRNAPSFSSTRFPDFGDQAFVSELSDFYADLLAAPALDPTVPANGPGDRVQTQAQAGTPSRPIDPTLPANGPGDRPATVNPAFPRRGAPPAGANPESRIPGTTGTENAGFPATRGGTVGRTGSPAGSAIPGGTVDGRTGSPASESIPSAAAGDVRTVARVDASASASRMTLRSSQMLGLSIQDKDGHSLGKVVDFVSDGNRQFVVVSLSGDKRNIVLPASALRFQAGAKGSNFATLRVAPGQLKNAPSFTGSEWPDFSSEEFLTNFQVFYQPLLPDVSFNLDGSTSTTVEGGTTPGGSRSTPGGTRTPDWPSRPIPPGGPVPRPGTETETPKTGKTTPGGSKSTPGGTRTPDWPSLPIPPGGPVPRPGAVGPRIPAPGTKVPGIPGVPAVPAVPGGPGVPATPATPAVPAAPSSPGPSASGGGGSGGASASGK